MKGLSLIKEKRQNVLMYLALAVNKWKNNSVSGTDKKRNP